MQKRSNLTPEEYGESIDIEFLETTMVKGVQFAKFEDNAGELRYHLIYPDGRVDATWLTEVYSEGNLTLAKTRKNNREVMVDDEGIHDDF
jgi:hypothetical protein